MARKKVVYVEKPMNITMYLLASLFLFLLTFFVILSSVSVVDNKRQKLAIGSLMGSFGILPGGRSAFNITGSKSMLPPSPPFQKGEIDIPRIDAALARDISLSGIGVSEGKLGATITIKAGILFEGQTDNLSPAGRPVLESIANILSSMNNPVIITGHTDSIPVETPPFSSNWGLSAARAMAVLSYFESRGIDGSRLAAYGMGVNRPITTNNTEAGRKLNRRVEITIVGKTVGKVDAKGMERSGKSQGRSIFYKGYNLDLEEK
jgi:chemotaxis protein MotB